MLFYNKLASAGIQYGWDSLDPDPLSECHPPLLYLQRPGISGAKEVYQQAHTHLWAAAPRAHCADAVPSMLPATIAHLRESQQGMMPMGRPRGWEACMVQKKTLAIPSTK